MYRRGPTYRCGPTKRGSGLDTATRSQLGITLLESLIALLVVTIGLLGVAAMQVVGVQEGAGAFRHSQATWLAYEMADRMRANLNPAALNPNDVSAGPTDIADHYNGIDVSADPITENGQVCGVGNSCNLQQMAAFDSDQWRLGVMDLPNGRGTVTEHATVGGRYWIRVMWDEVRALGSKDRDENNDPETGCPSDQTITQTCVETLVQP